MRRRRELAGLVGAALGAVTTAGYLVLVDPLPGDRSRIAVVACSLAAATAFGAWGTLARSAPLLGMSFGLFIVWGTLGILSIGLPLLVAAALTYGALTATAVTAADRTSATLAAVSAGAVSVAIAFGLA